MLEREANKVAHVLAKHNKIVKEFRVWMEKSPPSCIKAMYEDLNGVVIS